jgi:hypothetical protein
MASVETRVAGGRTFPRLHWSAVIAGVALAIAAHIVLGLVGATLGLMAEPSGSRGVGAAAGIWALVTPFVATAVGAWLACRMAGEDEREDRRSAVVHGVLVWAIGLTAGALFLTGTLATGAMTAGTAASGNLASAQRMARGEAGTARPRGAAEARQDEAAKRAAAGTGGAALGAIAGLLGAVVGAGLATQRRGGRGLGWRIGAPHREHGREERTASTTTYGAPAPRPSAAPGTSPESGGPGDPFHH